MNIGEGMVTDVRRAQALELLKSGADWHWANKHLHLLQNNGITYHDVPAIWSSIGAEAEKNDILSHIQPVETARIATRKRM